MAFLGPLPAAIEAAWTPGRIGLFPKGAAADRSSINLLGPLPAAIGAAWTLGRLGLFPRGAAADRSSINLRSRASLARPLQYTLWRFRWSSYSSIKSGGISTENKDCGEGGKAKDT